MKSELMSLRLPTNKMRTVLTFHSYRQLQLQTYRFQTLVYVIYDSSVTGVELSARDLPDDQVPKNLVFEKTRKPWGLKSFPHAKAIVVVTQKWRPSHKDLQSHTDIPVLKFTDYPTLIRDLNKCLS